MSAQSALVLLPMERGTVFQGGGTPPVPRLPLFFIDFVLCCQLFTP